MRSWSEGGSTGLRSCSSSSRTREASSRSRAAADAKSLDTIRRYARTSDSAYPRFTWLNERSAIASGVVREPRAAKESDVSVMPS